jgi:hypothetical protein
MFKNSGKLLPSKNYLLSNKALEIYFFKIKLKIVSFFVSKINHFLLKSILTIELINYAKTNMFKHM